MPAPLEIAQNRPFLTQSLLQALPAAERVVTGGINAAETASSCVRFELPPLLPGCRGFWGAPSPGFHLPPPSLANELVNSINPSPPGKPLPAPKYPPREARWGNRGADRHLSGTARQLNKPPNPPPDPNQSLTSATAHPNWFLPVSALPTAPGGGGFFWSPLVTSRPPNIRLVSFADGRRRLWRYAGKATLRRRGTAGAFAKKKKKKKSGAASSSHRVSSPLQGRRDSSVPL